MARLDLGGDGDSESWHRSKSLQRCKRKITGLCKLCIQGCLMVEYFITPEISKRITQTILAFLLLGADPRISSEFSSNVHACTPLSKARCDPTEHTHKGHRVPHDRAPGRQLPGASTAGLSHSARHRGAGSGRDSDVSMDPRSNTVLDGCSPAPKI